MQMDSSNTSSEIPFHGPPSKGKRPSIRKHSIVIVITVKPCSDERQNGFKLFKIKTK